MEIKKNELDLLSSMCSSPVKRGPIKRILQTLVNRKMSNQSSNSKSSFSTQYSYVNKEDSKNENLSQISDFELDGEDENSFHSSVNNSFLSANQITNISCGFSEYEDIEKEKIEIQIKKPIHKQLINLNLCK